VAVTAAWLRDHKAMLEAGVVFDWHFAADQIRIYRAVTAHAHLHAPGEPVVLIWADRKPAPRVRFPFMGNGVFELYIGDDVWNCFAPRADHPDWDENTYWPESALARLRRDGGQ
jgi:hypothetical protein